MIAIARLGQFVNGLLDASVKSAVVLLIATLLALLLRRQAAALRHLIWTLGVVVAVVMPALSVLLPGWRLNILPFAAAPVVPVAVPTAEKPIAVAPYQPAVKAAQAQGSNASSQKMPDPEFVYSPNERAESNAAASLPPVRHSVDATPSMAKPKAIPTRPVAFWILTLWAAGAVMVALSWVIGMAVIAMSARRGVPVSDGPLHDLLARKAKELGIRRTVRLVLSADCSMPMAWGILWPRIMFPASAARWPMQRAEGVVLHELSHVRRWDCCMQFFAHIARAIYWFNPLALKQAKFLAILPRRRFVRLERTTSAPGHGIGGANVVCDLCSFD